jgi:hypothetical protein
MAVAATARQAHCLYSVVLRVIVIVCIRFFSLDTSCLFFFPITRTRTYHAIVVLSVYIAVLRGRWPIAPCLASWRPAVRGWLDVSEIFGATSKRKKGRFQVELMGHCAVVWWWPRSEGVDRARQRRIRWKSFFFISCPCPAISANKKKHQAHPSPQAVS